MDPAAILAQLLRDFTYRADGRLDRWQVATEPGQVWGDCEDFALALAWRLAGGSWPRFLWHLLICKSVIWHCRTPQGGAHAALWHRGAGWACNVYPAWRQATPNRRRWPWLLPLVLVKLLLGPLLARLNRTL